MITFLFYFLGAKQAKYVSILILKYLSQYDNIRNIKSNTFYIISIKGEQYENYSNRKSKRWRCQNNNNL